jgi:hypothetical protein
MATADGVQSIFSTSFLNLASSVTDDQSKHSMMRLEVITFSIASFLSVAITYLLAWLWNGHDRM